MTDQDIRQASYLLDRIEQYVREIADHQNLVTTLEEAVAKLRAELQILKGTA